MNKKKQPKFRLYNSIEEYQEPLEEIKKQFETLKGSNKIIFTEFTEERIKELTEIINSDSELVFILNRLISLFSELENIHFNGRIKSVKDIFTLLFSFERMKYFVKYHKKLTDNEYWFELAQAYVIQDYSPVPYPILMSLFNSNRMGKENLMNDDEKTYLNNLPEDITIYRAMSLNEFESGKYRFSWTLSNVVAENFKERNSMLYNDEVIVHKLVIKKKDVLAYFDSRNEKEIIYLYNSI